MTVYFIQAGEGGPIKIGRCTDIWQRLSELQVGSHDDLIVLGVMEGNADVEAGLHKRFFALRVRGEWFESHPDIRAFIAESTTLPERRSSVIESRYGHTALGRWLVDEGVTAVSFAELIGVSPSTITRILQGTTPDAGTLQKIIYATSGEVTANDFFDIPERSQ